MKELREMYMDVEVKDDRGMERRRDGREGEKEKRRDGREGEKGEKERRERRREGEKERRSIKE